MATGVTFKSELARGDRPWRACASTKQTFAKAMRALDFKPTTGLR